MAAERLGMATFPPTPSGGACGCPVRKSWKNQVATSPQLPEFFSPRDLTQARTRGKYMAFSHTPVGPAPRLGITPLSVVSLLHRTPF